MLLHVWDETHLYVCNCDEQTTVRRLPLQEPQLYPCWLFFLCAVSLDWTQHSTVKQAYCVLYMEVSRSRRSVRVRMVRMSFVLHGNSVLPGCFRLGLNKQTWELTLIYCPLMSSGWNSVQWNNKISRIYECLAHIQSEGELFVLGFMFGLQQISASSALDMNDV